MTDELELPKYFPVSDNMTHNFETLRDNSAALDELRKTQTNILKAANTYFELLFPDDTSESDSSKSIVESVDVELIKELLDAYEKLAKAQSQTRHFNKTFHNAKQEIRDRIRTEPELTTSNLNDYIQLGDSKKSFGQILENNLEKTSDIQVDSNNQDYIFLKNATFVLDHPLDPLPDEDADDEIEVGGGTIDLRCPVSMNIFVTPMISKKCGHTFDILSIENTWRNSNVVEDCPIPGCSARLRRGDFIPDRLMTLRVKSYKAQQEKFDNTQEYEKLD